MSSPARGSAPNIASPVARTPERSLLVAGAVCCAILAVLHVLLRGVVLTEVVDAAQIITGAVQYPAGHPHQLFYSTAPALPNFIASAIWLAFPEPAVVSAVFNCLFLFLSLFLPYAVVAILTGRLAWGMVAVALTLVEGPLLLQGVYPMWVLPNFYVHGHIGIHLASLGVLFSVLGYWRSGGLILGILPAFHAPMALLAWPWLAAFAFLSGAIRDPVARRRFLPMFIAGFSVFAALILYRILAGDTNAVAPYLPGTEDARAVYQSFTALTDVHAQPFRLTSAAYGIGAVLVLGLGALLAMLLRRDRGADTQTAATRVLWFMAFIALVWVYVYGSWLYQKFIGPLPAMIALTRPYRFSNVSALFAIPFAVVLLASLRDRLGAALRIRLYVALIAAFVALVAAKATNPMAASRVELPALILMLATIAVVPRIPDRPAIRWSLIALSVMLAAVVILTNQSPFITRLVVFEAAFALLMLAPLESWPRSGVAPAIAERIDRAPLLVPALIAALILIGLPGYWDRIGPRGPEGEPNRWDRVWPSDRGLNQWLASNSEPGEMILPVMFPRYEVPAKTGHPVLVEPPTLYLMSYMPDRAGVVGRMVDDLYGVRYGDPAWLARAAPSGRLSANDDVWMAAWLSRTRAQWLELGAKYHFRLILAPTGTPIDLPVGYSGAMWSIYVIPSGGGVRAATID